MRKDIDEKLKEAELQLEKEKELREKIYLEKYKENYFIKKLVYIYEEYKKHEDEESEIDLNNLYFCYTLSQDLETIENTSKTDNKELEEVRESYINRLDHIEKTLTREYLEEVIDFYRGNN